MTTSSPPVPRSGTAPVEHAGDFRPDIQGLRALAVGLVVLFHLWPGRLPGGFVGVDVFFVISGYLITGHMYREVATTGSLDLLRFWGRRVRRLLPAAFLVLGTSLAIVLAVVPSTLWSATARQVMASALYVQNWALVRDSVTYMARDTPPTVAEHYWSLSVEEQFYLAWPLLVVLILAVRRLGRGRRRRTDPSTSRTALLVGLGSLCAASFVYSVVATYAEPDAAYFSTFTRAWEFGLGAVLAVLVARAPRVSSRVSSWATAVGWLGLVAIVWSGLRLSSDSFFPGWVALFPVLGTVAVIWAAGHRGPGSVGRPLSYRPATWLGDVSYSVYLWHWPLIVLVPYVTDAPLHAVEKVAIILGTLGLAAISKPLVEDVFRRGPLLAAARWRPFAFAAVGMALLVFATTALQHEIARRADAAGSASRRLLGQESTSGCLGPSALTPKNRCHPVSGRGALIPTPEAATAEREQGPYFECPAQLGSRVVKECALGVRGSDHAVAVVGDSHAAMWLPAFDQLGKDFSWSVRAFTKSSCPLTLADRVLDVEKTGDEQANCRAWIDDTLGKIVADPHISTVFVTAFSSAYQWAAPPGSAMVDPRTEGFTDAWRRLVDAGKTVVVVRDIPRTSGADVPTCLASHSRRAACAVPRDKALVPDAEADAARAWTGAGVRYLDLTDRFCDRTTCHAVVGDVIVYMDWSHLSGTYSLALAPYLEERVDSLGLR